MKIKLNKLMIFFILELFTLITIIGGEGGGSINIQKRITIFEHTV